MDFYIETVSPRGLFGWEIFIDCLYFFLFLPTSLQGVAPPRVVNCTPCLVPHFPPQTMPAFLLLLWYKGKPSKTLPQAYSSKTHPPLSELHFLAHNTPCFPELSTPGHTCTRGDTDHKNPRGDTLLDLKFLASHQNPRPFSQRENKN